MEEAVPRDAYQRSDENCDVEQLEALNVTKNAHKQETVLAIQNSQLHEISDLIENIQLKLKK